ncbi:MAG TPA: hydrogenase maturation protease [Candidatus Baltobacteraceae bacterium]|nr:hydrogenase maturation protease [Candidatus Baltobacteraceae bacterium]
MSLAVIGLGNVLLGDDGFGPFVVELLRRRYAFPPEVELLDLGTPGLGLISYLHGHDAVVIVDTIAGGGAPGELRVYEGAELERLPAAPRVSPHDPAVSEALAVARLAGTGPYDVCLVGAVPSSLELGAGLSRQVRAAADAAAEIVRRRVEERGFAAQRHDAGQVDDNWWLRAEPGNGRAPTCPTVAARALARRANVGSEAA